MKLEAAGNRAMPRPGRTVRRQVGVGGRNVEVELWKGLQQGTACVVLQLEREIGGYRAALQRIRDLDTADGSRTIAEAALMGQASAT